MLLYVKFSVCRHVEGKYSQGGAVPGSGKAKVNSDQQQTGFVIAYTCYKMAPTHLKIDDI